MVVAKAVELWWRLHFIQTSQQQLTTAILSLTYILTALLLAFGHRLHKELDVPVGLIVGAVGGTPSCMWLSQQADNNMTMC